MTSPINTNSDNLPISSRTRSSTARSSPGYSDAIDESTFYIDLPVEPTSCESNTHSLNSNLFDNTLVQHLDSVHTDTEMATSLESVQSYSNPSLSYSQPTHSSPQQTVLSNQPLFQFSQQSQPLFSYQPRPQLSATSESVQTNDVNPTPQDETLFQRFMSSFVEMTQNSQSSRDENMLDKRDRVAKNLLPITANEDLFSFFVRFEAELKNRRVRKDDWMFMLGKCLKGKYLELYHNNFDTHCDSYFDMKDFMLSSFGYGIHDCLDAHVPKFNPQGQMTSSQFTSNIAHRWYSIYKSIPFMSEFSDSQLDLISKVNAHCSVLAGLSRDGRTFVYKQSLDNLTDLIKACTAYSYKPSCYDRRPQHHSDRLSSFHSDKSSKSFSHSSPRSNSYPQQFTRDHDRSQQKHNDYRNPSTYDSHTSSSHTPTVPVRSLPTDLSNIQCFKCKQYGHYANKCPMRIPSGESPSRVVSAPTRPVPVPRKNLSVNSNKSGTDVRLAIPSASDVSVAPKVGDCQNFVDGDFFESDFYVNGTLNGFSHEMLLDSGAKISLVSKDFIHKDDSPEFYKMVRGVDQKPIRIPVYRLLLETFISAVECMFGAHPKLPKGTVLLGSDLGELFYQLFELAKSSPISVFATTRIRAREEVAREKQSELLHAIEGASPTPLESIADSVPQSDDCLNIDLSKVFDDEECTISLEEKTNECENCHDDVEVTTPPSVSFSSVLDSKSLVSLPSVKFDGLTKKDFIQMQAEDDSLSQHWGWAKNGKKNCFILDEVLSCLTSTNSRISHAVVVPTPLRKQVLTLAHEGSGHFGVSTTRALINSHFTWPSLNADVKRHVQSCKTCLKFNKGSVPKAPLCNPEILVERFEKLAIDVVGPMPKSKQGYRFLLTVMDLSSGFPFALPMRGYTAIETANNLLSVISILGPPKSILSDQGTSFLSRVVSELYSRFAIARVTTSPYHPESNGKLERFHSSLKAVLRKTISSQKDWPAVLDIALYFLRSLPHTRHGLTPYEVTFAKPTPHILAQLKCLWLNVTTDNVNVSRFICDLDESIAMTCQALKDSVANEVVKKRAEREKRSLRHFDIGQEVMKRTPGLNACLEASWNGPYVITEKVTDVNYKIAPKDKPKAKAKTVHINLLNRILPSTSVLPVLLVSDDDCDDEQPVARDRLVPIKLDSAQNQQLNDVLLSFHLFSDSPGVTDLISHSMVLTCQTPIWSPSFPIPVKFEQQFRQELDNLLELGIIEPSMSKWSSPQFH